MNGTVHRRPPRRRPVLKSAALESLSTQVLKDRIRIFFPTAYLALTGVIQAGALGQLYVSFRQPGDLATVLPQAIVAGTAVFVIYHAYLDLTLVLRWVPGILDVLVPFLLGAAEFWVDLAIGKGVSWWIAMAVLYAIGAGAFWHTLSRVGGDTFRGNPAGYRRYRAVVEWQIAACAAGLAVSVLIAALAVRHDLPRAAILAGQAAILAGGIVIAVLREYDQRRLYAEYGVWNTWRVTPVLGQYPAPGGKRPAPTRCAR